MRSSMIGSRTSPSCDAIRTENPVHYFLSKISKPRLKVAVLAVYYTIIIGAVIYVQLRANFASPAFIYQGF